MRRFLEYALWLAVLFVPFELYLRATGLGASARLTVHDSGLFLIGSPDTRVVYREEGFGAFRFNRDGLRGPALPAEPEAGELRVAFLGDSYVEAMQVADEDTFVARTAEALRARFPGATSLNFGFSGENLPTEIVRYRHQVRPRKPAVVVLVASDADLKSLPSDARSPRSRWDGADVRVDPAALEWNAPATARVFAWRQRLRDRLDSYLLLQRLKLLVQNLRGGPTTFETAKTDDRPETIALYAAMLRRLRDDVAADGGLLVGLHVPRGFAVRNGDRRAFDAYTQAFAQAGVPFLSALEPLKATHDAGRFTHYGQPGNDGGHLTPAGHAVVAEMIAGALADGAWAEPLRRTLDARPGPPVTLRAR